MKDYYKILGVPQTATSEEIKKRYHELAKQFHPDALASATSNSETNSNKNNSHQRFLDISEAYNILGNLDNRLNYSMKMFELQYKDFEFSEEDIIEIKNIATIASKNSNKNKI